MLSELKLKEMLRGIEERKEVSYDGEFRELSYGAWIVKNIMNGELVY